MLIFDVIVQAKQSKEEEEEKWKISKRKNRGNIKVFPLNGLKSLRFGCEQTFTMQKKELQRNEYEMKYFEVKYCIVS